MERKYIGSFHGLDSNPLFLVLIHLFLEFDRDRPVNGATDH